MTDEKLLALSEAWANYLHRLEKWEFANKDAKDAEARVEQARDDERKRAYDLRLAKRELEKLMPLPIATVEVREWHDDGIFSS